MEGVELNDPNYSARNKQYTTAFIKSFAAGGEFDYIKPQKCEDAPGLKKRCEKLKKDSSCAPCTKDDFYISKDKTGYVGCPYGCKDKVDPNKL